MKNLKTKENFEKLKLNLRAEGYIVKEARNLESCLIVSYYTKGMRIKLVGRISLTEDSTPYHIFGTASKPQREKFLSLAVKIGLDLKREAEAVEESEEVESEEVEEVVEAEEVEFEEAESEEADPFSKLTRMVFNKKIEEGNKAYFQTWIEWKTRDLKNIQTQIDEAEKALKKIEEAEEAEEAEKAKDLKLGKVEKVEYFSKHYGGKWQFLCIIKGEGEFCQHCGTPIVYECTIKNDEGKTLVIGQQCLEKLGSKISNFTEAQKIVAKRLKELKEEAQIEKIRQESFWLNSHEIATKLNSIPHPNVGWKYKSQTAMDWLRQELKCAKSLQSKLKVFKWARNTLEQEGL